MMGLLIITGIIFIKYKPVYKVTVDGEVIGYIENRNEFENKINEYINTNEEYVAFKTVEVEQSYNLEFVSKDKQIDENTVLAYIKENTTTIYTMYAIVVNDETTTSVRTEVEAQEIINNLKEKYADLNVEIGIREIYTTTEPDIVETTVAIAQITDTKINPIVTSRSSRNTEETTIETENAIANVNGVSLYYKPVSGTITSRFGAKSSIRSSAHTGLDIATKKGTAIKATAPGTVTFAGTSGSYGKLVKISHGNGVETWYAHCSKLYVSKGQTVSAGDIIAAVGSTGNSTGPHLHLEIRINGNAVNPQKYIY